MGRDIHSSRGKVPRCGGRGGWEEDPAANDRAQLLTGIAIPRRDFERWTFPRVAWVLGLKALLELGPGGWEEREGYVIRKGTPSSPGPRERG